MNKYLVATAVYNEGEKLASVVRRFSDYSNYDFLIVDDGSTDGSLADLPRNEHFFIVKNAGNCGAGYSVRRAIYYGKEHHYTAVIFVSGNNKDRPEDVYKLINAFEEGYDLVQGSRYLPGGDWGNMPVYRVVATSKIHPWLFSLVSGLNITDSTNGFRMVRVSLFDDKRINLDQGWLDQYEMEPYIFYKVIKLGYRVKEVPVVKIYPPRELGYTKMKPITGWWSILRPLIYLALRIKK